MHKQDILSPIANIVIYLALIISIVILSALLFYDFDKPIESIPVYTSVTELTDSPDESPGRISFVNDVSDSRTITLPDRDMDWQELMWESYQQGYDQGVKDSQTSNKK